MALVVKDRIRETTTTTGSGTITLAGAVTTFDAFSEIGDGNTTYYAIVSRDANEWEVGLGTYTLTGTTLARTTILASSNSGSAVVFSAGTKDVICTYPAGKSVYADASDVVNMGTTVISGSSSSDMLRITQTGAGNALLVEDSANPDSTPFVVTSGGSVVVGYTTRDESISSLEVHTPAAITGAASVGAFNWQAGTTGNPSFTLYKSQSGTVGTHGIVSSGAYSSMTFKFDDGTNFIRAASITAAVDGTPGTNDMPGRLTFQTTADGASSPTERMRIDSSGNVGIGTTTPGSVGGGLNLALSATGGARLGIYNQPAGRWWAVRGDSGADDLRLTARTSSDTVDTDILTLTPNAQLGIGITPDANSKLHVYDGTSSVDDYTVHIEAFTPSLVFQDVSTSSTDFSFNVDGSGFYLRYGDASTGTQLASTALAIDSSGNVGIGTTGPATKLHIYSDALGTTAGDEQEYFRATADEQGNALNFGITSIRHTTGTTWGETETRLQYDVDGNAAKRMWISFYNENTTTTDNIMRFGEGTSTEWMRLDNGALGIGTTSPDGNLNVHRTSASAGWIINGQTVGVSNDSGLYMDASNNIELSVRDGSGNLTGAVRSSGVTFFNGGNVGIGTTSPSGEFDLTKSKASAVTNLFVQNPDNTGGAAVRLHSQTNAHQATLGITDAGGGGRVGTLTSDYFYFVTNNTERARITSAGLIGIGRTPTTNLLEVAGTIESTTGGFKFPDGSTQTKSAGHGLSAMIALGVV